MTRTLTYEERKSIDAQRTDYPDEALHRRFRTVVENMPSGAHVLDIACGSGTLLAALREKGCTVRGIDIAPGAVAVARSKNLHVICGDVDSYEAESAIRDLLLAEYDAVVFSKCLGYLKCKNALLPQLNTPVVYVVQSNPTYWRYAWRRIVMRDPAELRDNLPYVTAGGVVVNSHTWSGLDQWAASYGFKSTVLRGGSVRGRDRVTLLRKSAV